MDEIIFKNKIYKKFIRFYYVSLDGDIISMYNDKIKKIKTHINTYNYERVSLAIKPNEYKKFYVHRIVYSVFMEKPIDELLVIDHIDFNTLNNNLANLRELSQKENILHSLKNGNFGSNNSKKCILYNKETCKIDTFNSVKELIDQFNYTISNNSFSRLSQRVEFKKRYIPLKIGKKIYKDEVNRLEKTLNITLKDE